jgi:hypothetical protein
MKRSPIQRRTPLARGSGLARTTSTRKASGSSRHGAQGEPAAGLAYPTEPPPRPAGLSRSTRLAPVNRERRAAAYARNFGPRADAIRAMPCAVAAVAHRVRPDWSPCWLAVEAAHSKARKMGGCGSGNRWQWPACRGHHEEAGEFRTSKRAAFVAKYEIDPVELSGRIAVELDERGLP